VSSIVKRTVAGALAALTLGLTFAATPASAQGWYGHRYGYGYHRGGWGGPLAAGVIGGLAVGALAGGAANSYYYPPAYPAYPGYGPVYGGGCYIQRQPMFGPYGEFLGYHRVRVCD
jgi:hypothetical protein